MRYDVFTYDEKSEILGALEQRISNQRQQQKDYAYYGHHDIAERVGKRIEDLKILVEKIKSEL